MGKQVIEEILSEVVSDDGMYLYGFAALRGLLNDCFKGYDYRAAYVFLCAR